MNTLLTADLHLNSNPRDEYRHTFVRGLAEFARKLRCGRIIILGDLTDEKDCHSAELVNRIVGYLYDMGQQCEVIILRGNHDCVDPTMPFFKFVHMIENVRWINDMDSFGLVGLGLCTFLPHTRDHERDWKKFSWAPYQRDPERGWIFCHNTFDGSDAGGGRRLRGIPTSVFPKHATVVSGDVHVPQINEQVVYVGAPYTINFGDEYKPRVLMLGTTTGQKTQMQSIPVPGVQKRLIQIKAGHYGREKWLKRLNDGDILKIKVKLAADDYSNWPQIQRDVRKWGEELNCVVHSVVPVKASATLRVKKTPTGVEHASDAELLEKYAKRRNVPADVLRTGLKLMETAS